MENLVEIGMGKGIWVAILGFLTSFVVVLLSTPALIKIAFLKKLVDVPDEDRKLHRRTIPSIGGILIFAGTLFSYFLWYPFRNINEYMHLISAIEDFKYIGAAMLILFFVGIKDDIVGTAPVKKLAGHLMVAFILVLMADIRITGMRGLFGIYELPYWASVFLSVFTYTVIVNAFNLVDGLDGLAAGVGSIVCLSFGTWFYLAGGIEMTILAMALAGALIGFLVFNFYPAKIFMGDSGSLTVGLIISVLSIKLVEFDLTDSPSFLTAISKPVFALGVLSYPLVDTLRVFTYRAVTGASPFSADRNHTHHRLQDIGMTDRQAVITIYLYNISIIAFVLMLDAAPSVAFFVAISAAVVLAQIPFLFKKKRNGNNGKH